MVAAINNIYPVITRRLWVVAFVFGLVHGFGFASVLTEFGLPPDRKLVALVSFNVGVELGQLAIVAALLPVLFFARRTIAYTKVVMPVGSLVISTIALIWLVERVTGVGGLAWVASNADFDGCATCRTSARRGKIRLEP